MSDSPGSCGVGRPAGIVPITSIPRSSNEKMCTSAVASNTTNNAPGTFGSFHWMTKSRTNRNVPKINVGRSNCVMLVANDVISWTNPSPSTGTPVTLSSCPAIMISAIPAM